MSTTWAAVRWFQTLHTYVVYLVFDRHDLDPLTNPSHPNLSMQEETRRGQPSRRLDCSLALGDSEAVGTPARQGRDPHVFSRYHGEVLARYFRSL